jgi:hypothetical protein
MKNIFEILAALGIVIPEDKKQDITKQVAENYKTVAEFEKVKSRLEVITIRTALIPHRTLSRNLRVWTSRSLTAK